MDIERLLLTHFRCFEEVEVTFSGGINLFWGENGVGKSSILEALTLFVAGQSYRTKKAQHLVQEGFLKSHAALHVKEKSLCHILEWTFDERASFFFGRKKLRSAGAVVGLLPGVSFTPQDSTIITGSSEERRHFLDLIIAQRDPLYLHHRVRYERGLKVRNENLKNQRVQMLDAIEAEMAKSASYIIAAREKGVQELLPLAAPLFHHLLGERKTMELSYRTTPALAECWKSSRSKELAIGFTLHGPHRDDVIFNTGGKEIRHFGSEGEKKSYLLALKLAHHAILKAFSGKNPLLLLDDLTASLDPIRIDKFWELAPTLGQVLITSTTPVSHPDTYIMEITCP